MQDRRGGEVPEPRIGLRRKLSPSIKILLISSALIMDKKRLLLKVRTSARDLLDRAGELVNTSSSDRKATQSLFPHTVACFEIKDGLSATLIPTQWPPRCQ